VNLLVVLVDCLRADVILRPRGDWPASLALAARGACFANAYATCPTTTPAVASLLTGRYPSVHGVRALRGGALAPEVPTVAETLTRAGSRTWASVTGPLLDNVGVLRGFGETEYRDVPDRSVHSPWGERAVERVRADAQAGRPFFGLLHVWDVHGPRRYPPAYDRRRFGRNAYERSYAAVDRWLARVVEAAGPETVVVLTGDHGQNLNLEPRNLGQEALLQRMNIRLPTERLAAGVAARGARSESKRLLRLAPRSLWPHNQTVLEPLVHVALLVAGPGIARGPRATPVSHVDLPPTFLDLAGIGDAGVGWQGVSLAASLREGGEPPSHPVVMEVGVGAPGGVRTVVQQAIRDGDWKLVTSLEDARVPDALYDLAADPGERRNLARERRDVVARLKERLRELTSERFEAAAMSEEDDAILAERLEELGYL
jgi:arylsulfatase A-like enzyme